MKETKLEKKNINKAHHQLKNELTSFKETIQVTNQANNEIKF